MRRIPHLLLAILLLLPATRARAGDAETERLREALRKARAELEAERGALVDARARFETEVRELRKTVGDLVGACESLSTGIEAAETALSARETEAAEAEAERDRQRAFAEDLRKVAAEKTEALLHKVEIGVPHGAQRARIETLRRLGAQLVDPGDALARAVRDFVEATLDEVRLGADAEIYEARVLTDRGLEVSAECLRLGKVFQACRTPDGSYGGLLMRGLSVEGGWEWRESKDAGAAVVQTRTGEAEILRVPLDVTLDIAADRLAVHKDILSTLVSGGWVMVPLALVALVGLFIVVERAAVLAVARPRRARVERDVLGPVRAGDPEGAERAAAGIPGPLAAALLAGLKARSGGKVAVEEALEEAAVRGLPRIERFLTALAALAAVSPLLGLLGTVTGMISTFEIITVFGTGDPRLLSGGISEALVTTQVGLVLAIPLLLIHRVFAGAVERTVAALETLGTSLVNALFHGVTERPGPGGEAP